MDNKISSSIIDCKKVYEQDKEFVKQYIHTNNIENKYYLAVIQIGSENESNAYITGKRKDFEYVGASIKVDNIDTNKPGFVNEIVNTIHKFNNDTYCAGIIVEIHRKLRHSYSEDIWQSILKEIDPHIDIDRAIIDNKLFVPATVLGTVDLLEDDLGIDLRGKKCVVIGRSSLVGKPIVDLLIKKGATVISCNSNTKTNDLCNLIQYSDIVISAVGKPKLINYSILNDNTVVIDIGTTYVDGHLIGDFYIDINTNYYRDPLNIKYTPVPGGMGLVTRGALLRNFAIGVSYREYQRKQTIDFSKELKAHLKNNKFILVPIDKKESE